MNIKENPFVTLVEDAIRLRESAQTILSDAMGDHHLSRLERLVLLLITEAKTPLTVSKVGRDLGYSRQVVQRASHRLLELGLLRKLDNPDHKASFLLEPTNQGLKFEEEMGKELVRSVNKLLSEKDLKLCLRLSKDLNRLRELIETYKLS